MIIAYFENGTSAEVAGEYQTEEEYMQALPELERLAKEYRMFVTESVID